MEIVHSVGQPATLNYNSNVKIVSPKIWDNKYNKYDCKFELDKKIKNMIIME